MSSKKRSPKGLNPKDYRKNFPSLAEVSSEEGSNSDPPPPTKKAKKRSIEDYQEENDNQKRMIEELKAELLNLKEKLASLTLVNLKLKRDKLEEKEKTPTPTPRKTPTAVAKQQQAPATAPRAVATSSQAKSLPPVVLRQQTQWTTISRKMTEKKIGFTRAKLISEGISITPARPEDHKQLTKLLAAEKLDYHTYQLPEAKQLRVVVRGLPDTISPKEVEADLREQGFSPASIHRMTNRRTKAPLPLVLVKLPTSEGNIFGVTRCCGLVVRVERQNARTDVNQCHRCQRFGHAQSTCSAAPKCVKCAGNHHSGDCKKPRDKEAKCINCGGPHPASYQGCKSFPKRKPQPIPNLPQPPTKAKATAAKVAGKSYAAASSKTRPTQQPELPATESKTNTSFSVADPGIQAMIEKLADRLVEAIKNLPNLS